MLAWLEYGRNKLLEIGWKLPWSMFYEVPIKLAHTYVFILFFKKLKCKRIITVCTIYRRSI